MKLSLHADAYDKNCDMKEHYLFYIGFIFILIHEMDAVRLQEWKMFPILSRMNDSTAYLVFTMLHIPLYGFLFWGLGSNQSTANNFILGLDVFFIIHIMLHLFLSKHKENRFKGFFSWALILLPGIFGLLDLLIAF